MKAVSRESLNDFRLKFQKHLDEFCQKEGLTRKFNRITYTPDSFHFKLEFLLGASSGDPTVEEKRLFAKNCGLLGLKPEDYGKEFESGGSIYYLVGVNPRAHKRPIVGRLKGSTKRYVFSDVVIRKAGIKGTADSWSLI